MTTEAQSPPANRLKGKPWTVGEAAGFLGISARTLWRMIDAKEARVTRLARRVFLPDAEVRRLAGEEGR